MLPLAAADPIVDNKDQAARLLRSWVHERRCAVQAQMSAAARDAQEGGSTLQDLPEMLVPYGLYILAHHPDLPQVRCKKVQFLRTTCVPQPLASRWCVDLAVVATRT
jgi:hypothetical protein